jgi:protein arginine N-methyltransferase 2
VCFCRVVQVELSALGLQTAFQQLRVADLGDDVWQGVRNKYWKFPLYFLPVVKHAAAKADISDSGVQELAEDGTTGA